MGEMKRDVVPVDPPRLGSPRRPVLVLGLVACGGPEISKAWNGARLVPREPYLVVLGGPRYFRRPLQLRQSRRSASSCRPKPPPRCCASRKSGGPTATGSFRPERDALTDRHQAGIAAGRRGVDAERDLVEQEFTRIRFYVHRHDRPIARRQALVECQEPSFPPSNKTAAMSRSDLCRRPPDCRSPAPGRAGPSARPDRTPGTGRRPSAAAHRRCVRRPDPAARRGGLQRLAAPCDNRRRT